MAVNRAAVLVGLLVSFAASAEPRVSNVDAARAHFDRGVASAAKNELPRALKEFEAAYSLEPHYSVLYNIAQAQSELGHVLDAHATFERYLRLGGARIGSQRRDQVQSRLLELRAQLGELRLSKPAPGVRIWLDGRPLEAHQSSKPILLTPGPHSVLSSSANGFPTVQDLTIAAGGAVELEVPVPQPLAVETMAMRVSCDLPGVSIEVDGRELASSPIGGVLHVPTESSSIVFSRPGYQTTVHRLTWQANTTRTLACKLVREPSLAPNVRASLQVRTTPRDARIFVDGERFLGGSLPFGPHRLRVEREGHSTHDAVFTLPVGRITRLDVRLELTPEHESRLRGTRRRQAAGYAKGGGGVAFALTGGALLLWNNGRYEDWRTTYRTASIGSQLEAATSIQRVDDTGIALISVGVGLLTAGAWLALVPRQAHE